MSVDKSDRSYKFVFVGGGTAGHIVPGLAIATALIDLGYKKDDILFIGSLKGMEKSLVPQAGFDLRLYNTKGLSRQFSLENFFKVLKMCIDNSKSFFQALQDLRCIKPDVIVMLGGYAGLIPALAGLVLGVKTAVVNVDSLPGLSNRIVGRFAALNTVPRADCKLKRTVVTGTPLRSDAAGRKNFMLQKDTTIASKAIKKFFGISAESSHNAFRNALDDQRPLLLTVMSGSLGAYSINKVIPPLITTIVKKQDLSFKELCIYHITGKRDYQKIVSLTKEHFSDLSKLAGTPDAVVCEVAVLGDEEAKITFSVRRIDSSNTPVFSTLYCITAYESAVPELLEASDLFLGRAGASTVAEIAAIGVPSVVVPLPNAPRDHQRENISAMKAEGALISLDDQDVTTINLVSIVSSLLEDEEKRTEMASRIYDFGQRGATATIADLLRRLTDD